MPQWPEVLGGGEREREGARKEERGDRDMEGVRGERERGREDETTSHWWCGWPLT